MKHYFCLIFTCVMLSTIVLTQKIQAYNSIQQKWGERQVDCPVFSQQDPNSGYLKTTVTAGKARSRIPSPMAGKSNLPTTLHDCNFVSVPNLRTGTIQEFKNYLIAVKCTPKEALGWHVAYMSDSYIAIIEDLPGYESALFDLNRKLSTQLAITKLGGLFTGTYVSGLTRRVARLCQDFENNQRLRQKQKIATIVQAAQAQQKSQVIVRQSWLENFELLQREILEWRDLSEIFIEHKFGDSTRLQKRIAVLNQISANSSNDNNLGVGSSKNSNSVSNSGVNSNSNFITQNYNISPEVNTVLRDTGLNPADYTSCYGNQFQQLIHQENLDQLQQLGTLSPLSPIFYHKLAITECVDSARAYNQAGLVHDSVKVTDLCWALIDYGKAICEGVAQGLIMVAKDLVDHPEQALLLAVAGEYVLAYQIAKVAYDVAKIGITAWQDPAQGQADWGSYIAPMTELVNALENNEIAVRDALKTGTMLAVSCRAQGKLSSGLGKLCKVTKATALNYLKNNLNATPQLYMSTPDGKLLKIAGEIKKLSNRERRLERIKHAKQATEPITEFLTEISKESLGKAIAIATTNIKLDHFFKEKHKLYDLVLKFGGKDGKGRENLVETVIEACVGNVPKSGVFENIPIRVLDHTIYISGHVINGVPNIGTMFIK